MKCTEEGKTEEVLLKNRKIEEYILERYCWKRAKWKEITLFYFRKCVIIFIFVQIKILLHKKIWKK